MKPHLLAIQLIEFISQANYLNAKVIRTDLIDLLDETRNKNSQSLEIAKPSFVIDENQIHVQANFINYDVYETFTISVSKTDFIKHLNFNGDAILVNQEPNHVNVNESLLGIHRVEMASYIDDLCSGRIAYKKTEIIII